MAIHSIITHTRDLDAPLRVTALRHCLVSGDELGDRFEVTVRRGGAPESVAGGSVVGYFLREADGATIPVPGEASGSLATLTLPEACYAVSGRFTLTVKVTIGQTRHAVAVFEGAVLRSATDAIVDPGHNIPDLQELLDQIARMEQGTAEANTATGKANSAASAANTAAGNATAAAGAANTAAGKADAAAAEAKNAASGAQNAAGAANGAAAYLRGATVSAHEVAPGGSPTATPSDVGGHLHIDFGLVRGEKGDKGEPGAKGDKGDTGEPGTLEGLTINGKPVQSGSIQLTAEDVGALPASAAAADSQRLGGKTLSELMLALYPVGSVFISTSSVSPATLFGGSWSALAGRFLLGAGSGYVAGATGGEATVSLTKDQNGPHYHYYACNSQGSDANVWGPMGVVMQVTKGNDAETRSSGSGSPHNNMPPYLVVYMWKRTA